MSVVTCVYKGCEGLPCPFPNKPHKSGLPSEGGCLCLAALFLLESIEEERQLKHAADVGRRGIKNGQHTPIRKGDICYVSRWWENSSTGGWHNALSLGVIIWSKEHPCWAWHSCFNEVSPLADVEGMINIFGSIYDNLPTSIPACIPSSWWAQMLGVIKKLDEMEGEESDQRDIR